jgi:hypothetical protein
VAEHTEGPWLDTDDGPQPLAVAFGVAFEGRAQAAYRAYVNHPRDCEACQRAAFQCEEAADLWQAYREARG